MAIYFPTLSTNPAVNDWSEEVSKDPTIRSDTENGYTVTRARFTRLRKKWIVKYKGLDLNDKQSLENFQKEVLVGSEIFKWICISDNIQYDCRLLKPIRFIPVGTKNYWNAELEIEEV